MVTAVQHRVRTGRHFECVASRDELRRLNELQGDAWLHPLELAELVRLRDESRREAWRSGRWVAKCLIREARPSCEFNAIAVVSRNERGESVRPQGMVDGELLPWSLSISHNDHLAIVFLELESGVTLGIDVVSRQPLSAGFQRTWFTPAERESLGEADADRPAVLWGAKEAVYKAVNDGERFSPLKFEVLPNACGELRVTYGGMELNCEIETRVLADDVIVIARNYR